MKLLNNNCGYVKARNIEIYRRLINYRQDWGERNNEWVMDSKHLFGAIGETLLIKTVFCEIIATDSDSKESDDRV